MTKKEVEEERDFYKKEYRSLLDETNRLRDLLKVANDYLKDIKGVLNGRTNKETR